MKQVTFSGLLILTVLFSVIYTNTGKDTFVKTINKKTIKEVSISNYRKVESVITKFDETSPSWLEAKTEFSNLLKISDTKMIIEMIKVTL